MTTIGIVLTARDGRAEVSTSRSGACGHCSERASCGVDATSTRPEVVTVDNPIDAQPGDLVELTLASGTAFRLSLIIWGLPLLGLIAGAAAGVALHRPLGLSEDVATLLGVGAGLALAIAIMRRFNRNATGDERLRPSITRVVEACSAPHDSLLTSPATAE